MRYHTKYNAMQSAVADFHSSSRALLSCTQRLKKVNSAIDTDSRLPNIRSNLNSRINSINKAAVAITAFGKAFEDIRIIYINGEQQAYQKMSRDKSHNISGIGRAVAFFTGINLNLLPRWRVSWSSLLSTTLGIGSAVTLFSWPKINWGFFKPVIDFIKDAFRRPGKWDPIEPAPAPKVYTLEQERAADLRMRNESLSLIKEYENKWRAARTEEEKRVLLSNYLADLQKIKGTSARSDINFVSLGKDEGRYNPHQKRISLNKDLLSKPEGIKLFKIVAHEVRHAYQNEAVKGGVNHPVSEETKQLWKNNMDFYIDPRWGGYDAYYNQPIEADAFWFSGMRDSK
jgi:hypothetical protein